jgi:hypothetical protein
MLIPIIVVLVGWGLNLAGLREACILLSLILAVATAIVWMDPVRLFFVTIAGAVVGALSKSPTTARTMAGKFLTAYADILGGVLLWGTIMLFILGTIPFRERPGMIFILTAGTLLLALMSWQWKIKSTKSRKLLYWFVVGMMVLSVARLIPGPIWDKYSPFGWNPTKMGTSQVEDTLYAIEEAKRDRQDQMVAERLQVILAEIKAGYAISPEEQSFVDSVRPRAVKSAQRAMAAQVPPVPEECTGSKPCSPVQKADGSTEKTIVKEGRSVCFESSFYSNLPRLGYVTSYKGEPEMKPGCTTASCRVDTFWFAPEAGVPVPKYWFVPEGSSRC